MEDPSGIMKNTIKRIERGFKQSLLLRASEIREYNKKN